MMKNTFLLILIGSSSLLPVSSNASSAAEQQERQHVQYYGEYHFQACSFESALRFQKIQPFSGFEEDIYQFFSDQNCPNMTAPISQVSNCISSFELDPSNMIQHLQSTIDVLNDYYVFKSIAVNPLASYPLKTPFHYPIYNGTDQGQTDIISGLEHLLQEVKSKNRATLDIFLQMNALAGKLFDSHLYVNDGISTGGILSNRTVVVFSGEVLDGSAKATKLRTVFPTTDDAFVLMADIITNEDSTVVTSKKIQKIDGKDPLAFFIEIATKPNGMARFKSVGARVQGMIKVFTSFPNGEIGYFSYFRLKEFNPDISKFLKDQYDILYEDGSNTTWKLVEFIPQAVSCDMTKPQIETSLLAQPGKMYQHLESMKRAVIGSETIIQIHEKQKREEEGKREEQNNHLLLPVKERMSRPSSTTSDGEKSKEEEKQTFVGFTMISKSLGYKIFDNYAVLKMDSFSSTKISESFLLQTWANITKEAHSKKVNKLIIDVIQNGGGVVKFGYYFAQLLYPDATWEDLSNSFDHLYTPSIEDAIGDIQGIMDTYYDLLQDNTIVEQITDTLNADPGLLIQKLNYILSLLEAMIDILSGGKSKEHNLPSLYLQGSVLSAIESVKHTRASVLWQLAKENQKGHLSSSTTTPILLEAKQLHKLWHIFVTVTNNVFNFPFSDLRFKTHFGTDAAYTRVSKRVEHMRGGILGNYTGDFQVLDPNEFTTKHQSKEGHIQYPFQFDQYIILGSGNSCGSTTAQFKHMLQAYAYTKNKESVVVPPVHTVSFGGTGEQQDAAVTQFPAGAMGEGGNVEELYLIGLILRGLNTLLPPLEIAPSLSAAWTLFDKFYDALPDACYYCNKAFTMSIYQVYSKLTGSESIPLEYVNELPDYYLRQWPTATSFLDDKNLPELYQYTSRFFEKISLKKFAAE